MLTVIAAFFVGVWWLLRRAIFPLVKHVIAPLTVMLAVLAVRWFSGAAITGKKRPATFLRGAVPPPQPAGRLPRINWAYWPGWQRATVRWVATGLYVTGLLWPAATGAGLAAVVLAAVIARYRYAIAAKLRRSRSTVVRVRSQVIQPQQPAVTATSDDPVWSTTQSSEAVTR